MWCIFLCGRKAGNLPELHRDSLVHKLLIKPDSPYYDWLERELAYRFNVACCVTQEQFRRETRAITRAGQSKDPSGRHVKDDRYSIDDRSRYVLGWNNSEKIAGLEIKRSRLETAGRYGGQDNVIFRSNEKRLRTDWMPSHALMSSMPSRNSTGPLLRPK